MQKWQLLPIDRIRKSSCNQRFELDEANVQRLCQTLWAGGQLPPIVVRKEDQHWACIDGFHRLEAHRRCGLAQIWVQKIICSDVEAILISHGSGLVATWTDGEKCATYARLYQLGASLEEVKRRFGDVGKKQGTIERYIVVGFYLHPSLLHKVRAGGSSGSIGLGVALVLSNLDHDTQLQLWRAGCCSSETMVTSAYKSLRGRAPKGATTLFRQIGAAPAPLVPNKVSPLDPLIRQIEAYALSEKITPSQVLRLLQEQIV